MFFIRRVGLIGTYYYMNITKEVSEEGNLRTRDFPAASPVPSRLGYCHLRSRGTNEQLLQNLKKKKRKGRAVCSFLMVPHLTK